MRSIWFIHGAHSSPRSFAWLKEHLPHHHGFDVEYGHSRTVLTVVDALAARLRQETKPVVLIGHSLGGLIALNLAHRLPGQVGKVVTLASPLGGVGAATVLRWMIPHPLLADIHPSSPLDSQVRHRAPPVPTLSLVATAGRSPLLAEPNDGVVTVSSQTCLDGPVYVEVPVNHFEILLAKNTVDCIVDFVF